MSMAMAAAFKPVLAVVSFGAGCAHGHRAGKEFVGEVVTAFEPGHPAAHVAKDNDASLGGNARQWWGARYRQLRSLALRQEPDKAFEEKQTSEANALAHYDLASESFKEAEALAEECQEVCKGVEGLQKTIKAIKDQSFEIERLKTSHSQELQRLDKSLQAEVEKRNATEKIHQSSIQEKDMELGRAALKAEELEKDLEKEKAKVTEKEEKLTSLQEQHEQAIINLKLAHAEVEKKLRSTSAELLEANSKLKPGQAGSGTKMRGTTHRRDDRAIAAAKEDQVVKREDEKKQDEEKITKHGKEQQKVEDTTKKLEETTEVYQKDKATYEATNADLTKAVNSAKRAHQALSESKGASFIDLGTKSDVQNCLDLAAALGMGQASDHEAASSFLQVDPSDPAFKFHSDKILTIISDLQKDFQTEKDSVNEEWQKTDKAYKAEKKDLEAAGRKKKRLDAWVSKLRAFVESTGTLPSRQRGASHKEWTLAAFVNGELRMTFKKEGLPQELRDQFCEIPGMAERFQDWDLKNSLLPASDEAEDDSLALPAKRKAPAVGDTKAKRRKQITPQARLHKIRLQRMERKVCAAAFEQALSTFDDALPKVPDGPPTKLRRVRGMYESLIRREMSGQTRPQQTPIAAVEAKEL